MLRKKKAEQGEKQKQLKQAEEKRREERRGEENRRDDDDDQRKVKNPNKQCGQGGSMRPTPPPLATHTYHATGPSTAPP